MKDFEKVGNIPIKIKEDETVLTRYKVVEGLEKGIESYEGAIKAKFEGIETRKAQIKDAETSIKEKRSEIEELKKENNALRNRIQTLQNAIKYTKEDSPLHRAVLMCTYGPGLPDDLEDQEATSKEFIKENLRRSGLVYSGKEK